MSHKGLFMKLIQRNVPFCWILLYWYFNLYSVCKWQNAYSFPFLVVSGVRQGGVLSAKFWAVYLDELIKRLRSKKIGCHLIDLFIACVLYADDVFLLAPTRKAMQELLDICSEHRRTRRDFRDFRGSPLASDSKWCRTQNQWEKSEKKCLKCFWA